MTQINLDQTQTLQLREGLRVGSKLSVLICHFVPWSGPKESIATEHFLTDLSLKISSPMDLLESEQKSSLEKEEDEGKEELRWREIEMKRERRKEED
jgi:hypothetical protein